MVHLEVVIVDMTSNYGPFMVHGRAATNDYFGNRLVGQLFFRLIDYSDRKINILLTKNTLLHIISNVFQTNVQTE